MATETLHPGRRIVLELPFSDYGTVAIAILDSAALAQPDHISCAAMLVPAGEERNWIYASEGGQWQLLASANVARMIIISRIDPNPNYGDDEALKTGLRPVAVALAPRVCFHSGPPVVPFLEYSDNVRDRVVVEEIFSPLAGWMVVEDVKLDDEREPDAISFRRRLRFKRMPNLIQTEVGLVVPRNGTASVVVEEAMRGSQIDHGRLVHKYLPPIVAGLVLAAPCIEACLERGESVKVLALGVGGGALPMFLHKQLGFHVQAVDIDKAVLDAAHRHFGLEGNSPNMEVTVADALEFIAKLAAEIKEEKTIANRAGSISRVHAIIVDVDEGDPRCGLSSPPSGFLEEKFLTEARSALHSGGLLAMNVVPNGGDSYHGVVASLSSVFGDFVYETGVEGDVNRVVFALTGGGACVNVDGPLWRLVRRYLDVRFISAIQKASVKP